MRNARGSKMSGSAKKKVNRNTYISSIKRVTRKFHVVVAQNNGKKMYKKSVLHVQSFFFFCELDLLMFFLAVFVAVAA